MARENNRNTTNADQLRARPARPEANDTEFATETNPAARRNNRQENQVPNNPERNQ